MAVGPSKKTARPLSKKAILDKAYTLAKTREEGGRFSKQDIEMAIKSLKKKKTGGKMAKGYSKGGAKMMKARGGKMAKGNAKMTKARGGKMAKGYAKGGAKMMKAMGGKMAKGAAKMSVGGLRAQAKKMGYKITKV